MWVEMQPSAQSSFQKLNIDNSCQKSRKIRYYIFEVFSNFTVFLQFVPNILPRTVAHMASFVNQFFFSRTEALIFFKCHTRLFVEPYWQSDFKLHAFLVQAEVLMQSPNKIHVKYAFHNKFRMIIFHDQKALSLNFKSSRSQMFFKIDVLKNLAMFTGKHLCWSYFLIQLQGWRTAIVLQRDSNTSAFL